MIVEIIRLEECFTYGTFGIMRLDSSIFCATLEPPDRLNKRNISSIPAKVYEIGRYYSKKFGRELYRVKDVPDRSDVALHPGTLLKNTEGCILLGQYKQKLDGPSRAIQNSGATFDSFMAVMNPYPRAKLIIREFY